MAAAALCEGASGQGCPPGLFPYGPSWWDPEIEHIVASHYGPGGPLVASAEDYARAERDVGLIRAALPHLSGVTHAGSWAPYQIIIQTRSLTIPTVTCTNTHFQAAMFPLGGSLHWDVWFPRVVNAPAMAAVYSALPEVVYAMPNLPVVMECAPDVWAYEPLGGETWRWTIADTNGCGLGGCCCCTSVWGAEVSASGVVCIVPDCNEDGELTVADFGCFQSRFVAGDPWADCNGDGLLSVADFGCFQTKFVVGCP